MREEFIRSNDVMARTLFAGVGGIGSEIVTKVAEMCRAGETENVNFVCMDTNANDLRAVKDSATNIYYVQTSSTQTVGDYLNYDKDAMDNWFPKNNVLYNKTVSEGAGQVRAISRLALNATIKNGNINPLLNAVDNLFRKDGEELQQALRIVLVSSASGGTGSGMVLPLSMYLRNYVESKYPNTGIIVRCLLLLPETLDNEITSNREKENQRRNAYATIKEINAFMMKGTGIFDTDPFLSKYKDLHLDFTSPGTEQLQKLGCLPCDFCFLLDGQNTEDSTLVNLAQYKEQAAQALYEQNIGPMQKRAFSVEDNVIREFTSPGNYARNRFGGIGASTLRYPYEDIADFIAYGWAADSIGGETEAAKWSRYDKIYKAKLREAKREGMPISEYPKISEVYTSSLINGTDMFTKSLIDIYGLKDVRDEKFPQYISALERYLLRSCMSDEARVANIINQVSHLSESLDPDDESDGEDIENDLYSLRNYKNIIDTVLRGMAQAKAEAVFKNETKCVLLTEPYMIEALIKRPDGTIYHPNAVRYVLYSLEIEMYGKLESTQRRINKALRDLVKFEPENGSSDNGDYFYVKGKEYPDIDSLIDAAVSKAGKGEKFFRKGNEYYEVGYERLQEMYNLVNTLAENTVKCEGYKTGIKQIKALISSFEDFYYTFSDKVILLEKRREDIIEKLKFRKGDSILNICSEEGVLKELEASSSRQDTEGTMLDSDLCGEIFDAVKANAKFEEEIKYMDVVEGDQRIDIFDSILLDYFRKEVRRKAESIDMNIIEAVVCENHLKRRNFQRESMAGTKNKIFTSVSPEEDRKYIDRILSRAKNLAAPGIQPVEFDEQREINLSAYNQSLKYMKGYRIDELLNGGVPTDTISSYEIHFFRALYNLTPDSIDKFACEKIEGSKNEPAGLYHKAYMNYSKTLGPDSMKDLQISTHIDKRWDSVAFLPELDISFLKRQMTKVHQALIYALVYDVIVYRPVSLEPDSRKKYMYEDPDYNVKDLVTPGGSICTEFYDILNAFYINPMLVSEIENLRDKRREDDKAKNREYEESTFKRELENLNVEYFHNGKTSLFELPLMYYNTLPNTLRSSDEVTALIDAVIKTFYDEIGLLEMESDVKMVMAKVLFEDFGLLIENYKSYNTLNEETSIKDNVVLDVIFRKVKRFITEEAQPSNADDIVIKMKALIKEETS